MVENDYIYIIEKSSTINVKMWYNLIKVGGKFIMKK